MTTHAQVGPPTTAPDSTAVRAPAGPRFRSNGPADRWMRRVLSVDEVARCINEVVGSTAGVRHVPMRPGERPGCT